MRRDDDYLRDMLASAREALELTHGLSQTDFARDRRTQHAVLRLLGIIGEAASRLSAEAREKHPAIPWPKIVAMRNHLIHPYFQIDLDVAWRVVQEDLPVLISQLEPLPPPEQE